MAAGTFGELASVDVIFGMTLTTVLPHTTELPAVFVTLATFQGFVHPDQLKVFVEAGCFVPSVLCMAGRTLLAKPTVVDVLVAALTIPQEQILKNVAALFVMGWMVEGFGRWLMAFDAFYIQVQPFEDKAGDVVVEGFAGSKL